MGVGERKGSVLEDLIERAGGCAVIDGGFATQLEKHGASINDPLWSALCLIKDPHLIKRVHMEYLEAGADVLITSSYQATLPGFLSKGLSMEEAESLLEKSVKLAIEARDKFWDSFKDVPGHSYNRALVAASIGSYGAYLADGSEYSGCYGPDTNLEKLKDFHRHRLQILVNAGADLLAFETIPNKLEAQTQRTSARPLPLALLSRFPRARTTAAKLLLLPCPAAPAVTVTVIVTPDNLHLLDPFLASSSLQPLVLPRHTHRGCASSPKSAPSATSTSRSSPGGSSPTPPRPARSSPTSSSGGPTTSPATAASRESSSRRPARSGSCRCLAAPPEPRCRRLHPVNQLRRNVDSVTSARMRADAFKLLGAMEIPCSYAFVVAGTGF